MTSCEITLFSTILATELKNPDLAIIAEFFSAEIQKLKNKGEASSEGRTWISISIREIFQKFPFWSEKQIKRKIEILLEKGIFLKKIPDGTLQRVSSYAFKDEDRFVKAAE